MEKRTRVPYRNDTTRASDKWYKYTRRVCMVHKKVYKYIDALLT